ncbi:hypothetical protein SAMN04487898_12153 [Pedobacter sp. ok626]|uniref:DUF5996 family protein n=1 Tax=Pedobacter sp. ok626 TaxID=1761882 RepID=UPI00088D499F|nr:DUF5996 family protein [Pedobacter sp. ok626]SDL59850.1 hypothetical protein SAMN04487898_12153 [Pedobacter sp. ok626]
MEQHWPILSYEKGKATYETLQLWSQIVGKIKLAVLPWVNHSWHITLHITTTGLTTGSMRYNDQNFQIDFDFIAHQLKITTSNGENRQFDLHGISVADFYGKIFELLNDLKINVTIRPVPVELADPIPFEQDTIHATYEDEQVTAFHKALLNIQDVFMKFRAEFRGKCSPIHFFWGSFDLALSFFSGATAPKHAGGIPGMPNWVAEDAYCKEVSSCGFWTGGGGVNEAAFYCYLYPEPEGYKNARVKPDEAYYHQTLGEFILPYSAVQGAGKPEEKLIEFLRSTYSIGADLAKWDRESLEY